MLGPRALPISVDSREETGINLTEDYAMDIKPCQCGCADLVIWQEEPFDLNSIAKIECPECGNIVYGCDEDSVDDWNNQRYDE